MNRHTAKQIAEKLGVTENAARIRIRRYPERFTPAGYTNGKPKLSLYEVDLEKELEDTQKSNTSKRNKTRVVTTGVTHEQTRLIEQAMQAERDALRQLTEAKISLTKAEGERDTALRDLERLRRRGFWARVLNID